MLEILVLEPSEPAHLVIVRWVHAVLVSAEETAVGLHMDMPMAEEQALEAAGEQAVEAEEGVAEVVVVRRGWLEEGGYDTTSVSRVLFFLLPSLTVVYYTITVPSSPVFYFVAMI
tara:strand:- start:307 stop:651 length:345 start_codon:yes stop_codon:yes gene_type:complete